MAAIQNALVVGGGFSGMAAAIELAKAGVAVDLIELDPKWRPEGAGISISGPTLRALERLGVYDEVARAGFVSDGLDLRAPPGMKVGEIPTPKAVGSDAPGNGGVLRPELARILAEATRAAGVNARAGCSYEALEERGARVHVRFTDGTDGDYDLVVGAEGLRSKLRERLFAEAPSPRYVGQVVWRAVLSRPAEIVRPTLWVGGAVKLGVNPVSSTQMYLFLTEGRPEKSQPEPASWPRILEELMRPFPDPLVQAMIPQLYGPGAGIDYRPLANLIVPAPWNRGRVVLIGDAVHATTPHLASGAGIGVESAIVLAEEIGRAADLASALDRFHARRFQRCRMVIENSEKLCRIEREHGDMGEHARIMRESIVALLQPI
jgi:2-polyprenyl-6-methoxyphenol hydroxylase-like FAD-dependent oxidoreductase